jgi:hypothetical protein
MVKKREDDEEKKPEARGNNVNKNSNRTAIDFKV